MKSTTNLEVLALVVLLVLTGVQLGCQSAAAQDSAMTEAEASQRSALERVTSPTVGSAELSTTVHGNSQFALDLYRVLSADESNADQNLFFSPYSISTALGMAFAGARNETEAQMASALHFDAGQGVHEHLNAIELAMMARAQQIAETGVSEESRFRLNVVNQLWTQTGMPIRSGFLDTLASYYGADVKTLDFQNAAEDARQTINRFISEATNERIPELLPAGSLDDLTRAVLTNAVYFNASWLDSFGESGTEDRPFTLSTGETVQLPTMENVYNYGFNEVGDTAIVDLPYQGRQMSMTVMMPPAGELEALSASLDDASLASMLDGLSTERIRLHLPRFTTRSSFDLGEVLQSLGMVDAFFPAADFSGINNEHLYINQVYHQAFVSVDESGTEAAAATAVVMSIRSGGLDEPRDVNIDRPFLFVIRDTETGSLLFMGRVMDPRG